MNREAELRPYKITNNDFSVYYHIPADKLNSLIDRLVIEGQNSKLDKAIDMARRADDFVGDVKVVRVTHLLSLKALLSQSSQPLADSREVSDEK